MRLEVVYIEHRHGLLLTLKWPLATRTEGYSSGRVRARGPVRSPLSLHILQNRPVEIAAPLLALLEVLGADVGAQGIEEIVVLDILLLDVTSSTQHVRYFPANVTVNADDVLWLGLTEVEGVEVPDPNQLPYRVGVVVHAQVHYPVVVTAVSAALPYDEQRRRLLSPGVSPGRLPRVQRREQSCAEVSLRLCEGSRHRLDRLPTDEDIALGRVVSSGRTSRPLEALGAREGSSPAPGIDDTNLPVLAVFVGGDQTFDGLISGFSPSHKLEPVRPIVIVRHRLRRHSSDAGTRPGNDRANGEELGLNGDAKRI